MNANPMVVAAARVLSTRYAEQCCVDAADVWKTYGEDFIADAQAALDASGAPALLSALNQSLAVLEQATCSTGYCCCGSSMESHGIYDGHGPVDEGDYYQSKAIEASRAAISKSTGEQP